MLSKIPDKEYREYLDNYIANNFKGLIDKDIYSIIINREFVIEIATNKSAKSVGFNDWHDINSIRYSDYEDKELLKKIFKVNDEKISFDLISNYLKKLFYLQKIVFEQCKVVKFIDMLPYDNKFISYITTYFPLVHPNGEVVAIQSSSIKSYILRFQGHIESPNASLQVKELKHNFTNREMEILFLLTNGATQDQIAQVLNISRGTVSAIIGNQICPKFSIAGANTKILVKEAINAGFYRHMPKTLWKPCIIVLNEELLDDPFFKEDI